jgi:hypothetical protein
MVGRSAPTGIDAEQALDSVFQSGGNATKARSSPDRTAAD